LKAQEDALRKTTLAKFQDVVASESDDLPLQKKRKLTDKKLVTAFLEKQPLVYETLKEMAVAAKKV
jgi:hypothetical protein